MESTSIWQSISDDLRKKLKVDPGNMMALSETFVAMLIEKQALHEIPLNDVYLTLKNLLGAFVGSRKPPQGGKPQ